MLITLPNNESVAFAPATRVGAWIVLYDADGVGSDAAIVVGAIFKAGTPVTLDFSDLKGLSLSNNNTLTKTGSDGWSDGGSYSTSSIRILVNLAPLCQNAVSKCKASVVLVSEV
jgi:hypothetical protein